MYEYEANVTAVYDGDTITVDIDLGLGVWVRGEKIRLIGIDAPEVRGPERPEGLKSRDWLRALVLEKTVVLQTIKDRKGKYGRYLAHVFLPPDEHGGEPVNVAELSVLASMSVRAEY